MFIGMLIGVSQMETSNAALYGVTVIFLVSFCDLFPWFLRQLTTSESLLISYERAANVAELPS